MSEFTQGGNTGCLDNPDVQIGSTTSKLQTGNAISYAINGQVYSYAATDNITVTAHAAQAVSTSCLYLLQIDSGGTVSTKKGTEELTADLGDNLSLQWPYPDADNCPIGGYKVALNASTTFTNGTTALDAAGVTDTYYNFALGMPTDPQVS